MQNEERRGERYSRLSELGDFHVSPEDPDPRGWAAIDQSGEPIGRVSDLIVDTDAMKVRYLEVDVSGASTAGGRARIPAERVDVDSDAKTVMLDFERSELASYIGAQAITGYAATDETDDLPARHRAESAIGSGDAARLTVAEEELRVGTRPVQAGEVVVGKHVETERVTTPVERRVERVRIERRPVTGATAGTSELGEGEVRIPVMEEQVVVEKHPVIKEEVVITREAATVTEQVEADVRRERVDVDGDETLIEAESAARARGRGGNRG